MNDIIYNAIQTPDGTILESRSRHDYKIYTDANGKEYMVDGGFDYQRRSANGDEKLLMVTTEDKHKKVREYATWGSYGVNGDQPRKEIKVKDMELDHISAVLKLDYIRPAFRTAMQNELEYRNVI